MPFGNEAFMSQVEPSLFNLNEYCRRWAEEVTRALEGYCQFGSGCPEILEEAIRYSTLAPAKRLRPLLVLMAAEACGLDPKRAMPAACAVELIHTYSLIHDDLPAMDDDDLRRGQPSCHIQFGQANAILAGDAMIPRAFEILASEIKPAEVALRCVSELAKTAGATALVGGQVDDLRAEGTAGDLEQLFSIHSRKTGAMMTCSLRLGAIVAEAEQDQLLALTSYGKKLGLMFQIVDDLLDDQGSEQDMGKRTQKDQSRGKLTYPSLLGAEEARRQAEVLAEEAAKNLSLFGERAEPLEALTDYILDRKN